MLQYWDCRGAGNRTSRRRKFYWQAEELAKILATIKGQGGFILYEEYHKGGVLHNTIFLYTNSKCLTLICNDKHKIDTLRMLVLKPL